MSIIHCVQLNILNLHKHEVLRKVERIVGNERKEMEEEEGSDFARDLLPFLRHSAF